MNARDMATLLEYNYWANELILQQVERLTPEQLRAPARLSHGSAFDLVRHMLDTEWSWRLFASGGEGIKYLWEVEDVSNLPALRRFWRKERVSMLAYLNELSEADLERDVDYGAAQGRQSQFARRWHILLHIVNHSTHHRSELGRYLDDCGHPIDDLGVLDFAQQSHLQSK